MNGYAVGDALERASIFSWGVSMFQGCSLPHFADPHFF